MVDRQAVPAHVLQSLRWPAAAILTVALAFGAAHTAHAGTHLAAHTSTHMAQCHPEKKICDPGPGMATPELPSGELAALGLVPVFGHHVVRAIPPTLEGRGYSRGLMSRLLFSRI